MEDRVERRKATGEMEDRVERTKATVMLKNILVANMTSELWRVVLCAICLNIMAKLFKAISIEVGETYIVFAVMIIIFLCRFLVNAGLMGIMGKGDVFRRWCCRNKVVLDFITPWPFPHRQTCAAATLGVGTPSPRRLYRIVSIVVLISNFFSVISLLDYVWSLD